jgi:hypothetical protein
MLPWDIHVVKTKNNVTLWEVFTNLHLMAWIASNNQPQIKS